MMHVECVVDIRAPAPVAEMDGLQRDIAQVVALGGGAELQLGQIKVLAVLSLPVPLLPSSYAYTYSAATTTTPPPTHPPPSSPTPTPFRTAPGVFSTETARRTRATQPSSQMARHSRATSMVRSKSYEWALHKAHMTRKPCSCQPLRRQVPWSRTRPQRPGG